MSSLICLGVTMFKNIVDGLIPDIENRLNLKEKTISFGIKYLDDALVGIAPDDLILLGARSGAGKTQLCVNIAKNCISQKKRCHFFALEASENEITRRLKFEIFQNLYKKRYNRPCDFQKWCFGFYLPSHANLEAEANEEFVKRFRGDLKVFYKRGSFGVQNMVEKVLQIADHTDLIIIDHVHYFDLDDDNENRAVKEIAKTARDLVLEQNKPIILVSHIRKGFNTNFAPTLEEFHGSSDLYKIATRAITLGPGDYRSEKNIAETYVHIAKNRFDGSVTRFTGRVAYNLEKGSYEKQYQIGKSHQKREGEFECLDENELPGFAKASNSSRFAASPERSPQTFNDDRGKEFIQKLPYKD